MRPGDKIDPIEFPTLREEKGMANNGFLTSFFGKIFHGCWHRYKEWSQPFRGRRSIAYQEKECRNCGRIVRRTVSMEATVSDETVVKPKKPSQPPKSPKGGTGEL